MKDCFAYLSERRCVALKEKNCDTCRFYKTKAQAMEDEIKAKKRAVEHGYYITKKEYEPKC